MLVLMVSRFIDLYFHHVPVLRRPSPANECRTTVGNDRFRDCVHRVSNYVHLPQQPPSSIAQNQTEAGSLGPKDVGERFEV